MKIFLTSSNVTHLILIANLAKQWYNNSNICISSPINCHYYNKLSLLYPGQRKMVDRSKRDLYKRGPTEYGILICNIKMVKSGCKWNGQLQSLEMWNLMFRKVVRFPYSFRKQMCQVQEPNNYRLQHPKFWHLVPNLRFTYGNPDSYGLEYKRKGKILLYIREFSASCITKWKDMWREWISNLISA